MPDTETDVVVTIEPETDHQEESTPTPTVPSVTTFKEIVMRHCRNWDVSNVNGLCTPQTETLIAELAQHFR